MAKPSKEIYDVVVIGGGAAGLMAAGRAAELGASVLLLEKNEVPGKKLVITGGGRCNMTNVSGDTRVFLSKLKEKGKFLFSTFAQHNIDDSLEFFHNRNVGTKVENEGRVFPLSDDARTVFNALKKYTEEGRVEIVCDLAGKGFHVMDGEIVGLNTSKNTTIVAKNYILATGGTSHPETGSTGEGFEWLRRIGHTIREADASLIPIKIKERWVHDIAGISNQDAKLSLYIDGKKVETRRGRMVFTHFGISGPLVLNFSRDVREAMKKGVVELSLDIEPNEDYATLDKKILSVFENNKNKKLKNALTDIVQPALVDTILKLAKLDGEFAINEVLKAERITLGKTLKDLRMTPNGFLPSDKAIVAAGGVAPEEIDFKTMKSKLFPNLFIIGDVLDIDRPSGGYSLQLCWSTGWVAGTHSAEGTNNRKEIDNGQPTTNNKRSKIQDKDIKEKPKKKITKVTKKK